MNYNAVIIGFGKAGKTLAAALANKGETVALIEKSSQMYGGTCINMGCIPSKSLVASAEEAARNGGEGFVDKSARYKAAIDEKKRVTSMLRQKNYDKLNSLENVTIYDGIGSFVSANEVEVQSADGEKITLEADKIFINTGSQPVIPNIDGVKNNPHVHTSETLMNLSVLPAALTIIGAGYIGMEFASMYAGFGSRVTVLQAGGSFLPREDKDVADEIFSIMQKRGIEFIMNADVKRLERGTVIYEKDGKKQSLESDAVLLATGRKPNTDALNAQNAGVELTPRGAVKVDESLKTTAPNIWAMGDVNGGAQFTFISLDDFRIVLSQLNGGNKSRAQRKNAPYSVFMDTPLARVGLTEKEAREQSLPIKVMKLPTAAVPKAQVLRKTSGFLKAIVNTETNKILGAALLCPEAYEMINTISLAMNLDAGYETLKDTIYTHPTMTEAFNDLFAL